MLLSSWSRSLYQITIMNANNHDANRNQTILFCRPRFGYIVMGNNENGRTMIHFYIIAVLLKLGCTGLGHSHSEFNSNIALVWPISGRYWHRFLVKLTQRYILYVCGYAPLYPKKPSRKCTFSTTKYQYCGQWVTRVVMPFNTPLIYSNNVHARYSISNQWVNWVSAWNEQSSFQILEDFKWR